MKPTDQLADPPCGHLDGAGISPESASRLGLKFPDLHCQAAGLAALARQIKNADQGALCLLPFCCTVEAEALGASIHLGNADS